LEKKGPVALPIPSYGTRKRRKEKERKKERSRPGTEKTVLYTFSDRRTRRGRRGKKKKKKGGNMAWALSLYFSPLLTRRP